VISRRSLILGLVGLAALLLGFSWVNWLAEAVWLERHPRPHEITGSVYSLDPESVWTGPTLSQKILLPIGIVSGILALGSLAQDKKKEPKLHTRAPRFGWSRRQWDHVLNRALRSRRRPHEQHG